MRQSNRRVRFLYVWSPQTHCARNLQTILNKTIPNMHWKVLQLAIFESPALRGYFAMCVDS